jgi:DNA mismatch repair protein MutS2
MEAREEVEEAIRKVRSAGDDVVEDAARDARRSVEEAADRQRRRSEGVRRLRRRDDASAAEELEPGVRVRLGAGKAKGTLVELRDGRGIVEVSGMRMEVPAGDLVKIGEAGGGESPSRPAPELGWSGPVPDAGYEIDLRGLRVDEVSLELGRSLDAAILSDLNEVRVIHGKGTGAVKSKVRELLHQDARVASFRDGHPGEGGAGVTLVEFR